MAASRILFVRGGIILCILGTLWSRVLILQSFDSTLGAAAADDSWREVPDAARNTGTRNDAIQTTTHPACNTTKSVWGPLCEAGFIQQAESILNAGPISKHMSIVQIGAHTGWRDENDPFVKGMTMYLESLPHEKRKRIDYTLVEASPVNFAVLETKIQERASLCNLQALWAGIVPDTTQKETSNLIFYGISADIDVDTGLDSRSGKQLPVWASQLSSFSKQNILKHQRFWKNQGLELEDYIEEMQVKTIRFSELLSQQQGDTIFVLIDTEGLDCDIVRALSSDNVKLPPFILYERKHCGRKDSDLAKERLEGLGYQVNPFDNENVLASRSK